MDVLLTHGYFLYEDPHELAVMKPYPPLGLLYVNSHLKARGVDSQIFDSTFARFDELEAYFRKKPAGRGHLQQPDDAHQRPAGDGRPERRQPAGGRRTRIGQLPGRVPSRGADVVVIGEGELTLEELSRICQHGPNDLDGIQGIAFRDDSGAIVRTEPRPMIADLDAQPFPIARRSIITPTWTSGASTTAWARCR